MSALAFTPPARADEGCPDGQPCLLVSSTGHPTPVMVTFDDLTHDVSDASYPMRNDRGPAPGIDVATGTSITQLVADLSPRLGDFGLGAVTFVEVSRPGQFASVLRKTPGDLDQDVDHDSFEGGLPPVVYLFSADSMAYLRPQHDDADVNVDDQQFSSSNGPLQIVLHTSGDVVHPTIAASPEQPDEYKDPVTITATFAEGKPDGLRYDWDFGDSTTRTTRVPSVVHRWTAKAGGTYVVRLSVSSPSDDTTGQSNVLTIINPPKEKSTTTDTDVDMDTDAESDTDTHTDTHADTHTDTDSDATPDSDVTTGPNDSVGHVAGTRADPDADPDADTGNGGDGSSPDRGTEVAGLLLVGDQVAVPETDSGTPATAPARAVPESDRPIRVPEWVLLVLGFLAVLGLGALSETAWVRRRLRGRMRT